MEFLLPVLLVLLVVMLFVSQRKRKRQMQQMRAKLVPGVNIMTSFGLFGTLKSVSDNDNKAEIEVAPGCVVTVHSQVLAQVEEDVSDQSESAHESEESEHGEETARVGDGEAVQQEVSERDK